MKNRLFLCCFLLLTSIAAAPAADRPQWGTDNSRNMISLEKRLPDWFGAKQAVGKPKSYAANNIKWIAELGMCSYGTPTVAGGKVFIGTTTRREPGQPDGNGLYACFDEKTGKCLWKLIIPRLDNSGKPYSLGSYRFGVCSTGTVENGRVYMVSNKDELLCLDAAGQANGNAGPFKDEAKYMTSIDHPAVKLNKNHGDIIWKLDMVNHKDIDSCPHDAADCSPLVLGNYVYVSPSNGKNRTHKYIPCPDAPSLIAVDKKTGRLVARDRVMVGSRMFHGEWSSPSSGKVGGRNLVFYGAGDGVCYAFDAKPTPPSAGQSVGTLKMVWSFDVSTAAGRHGNYHTLQGPSEVVATPVFYRNRVYVAIGQDPLHGKGFGGLACIDATKKGDITQSGKKWVLNTIGRSMSSVAVADGLVYAADNYGSIYCLDAETGKVYWKRDTGQRICSSPMVADGKVYVGTERGSLWIFKTGKTCKILNTVPLGASISATATPANGALFVGTQTKLFAAKKISK